MNKRPKPKKPPLHPGTRILALAQARAFAANSRTLASQLTLPADAGMVMAYLVNAGLAIELYLKTFMIAGRGGQIEEWHNLSELLNTFPDFLRGSLNSIYDEHPTAKTAEVRLISLKLTDKVNGLPTYEHADRYGIFDQAIASVARVFVEARYFFERVNPNGWVVIAYPIDAVSAILHALETTYDLYESGQVTGKA